MERQTGQVYPRFTYMKYNSCVYFDKSNNSILGKRKILSPLTESEQILLFHLDIEEEMYREQLHAKLESRSSCSNG